MAVDGTYGMGGLSASEMTEEIDDFLEKTETEYLSDDDECLETIDNLRGALRGKEKHIKNIRCVWMTILSVVT